MSVRSMTGYASTSTETAAGLLTIELKSVNSRYLDLQFRMSDELRTFEPMLREAVMQQVTRGKIECRISLSREKKASHSYALNHDLLKELAYLQDKVRQQFSDAGPLTVNELLRWPGVIEEANIEHDMLQKQLVSAISSTVESFVSARDREGHALTATLLEKVESMEAIVQRVTPLIPQILMQFQQKSMERMQEALGLALTASGHPLVSEQDAYERIRQEVLMYGTKIDVSEELSRMAIHLDETRNILNKGGPVGKRLDFMLQELNREANTLGSKATVRDVSDASIDLKLLIEQMREQVQNLE
ncbi:YicC family protein [Oxalobacter sp. OttesenSCG-928-P03]|nr:YicC family protein [Oxalobacter sp. OttesenSCG-928-P03]